MKLTKRLIPAFAMLLVSAVLMSTASFAWFSMNNNVTATGMTVSAQSESIFLEIKGTEDDAWKTTGTNAFTETILPVAHAPFASINDVTTPEKWFYCYVTDPTQSGADIDKDSSNRELCTTDTFAKYVVKTSYTVRLNPNMVTDAHDVYVSSITLPENTGISVIIACGDKFVEFKESNNDIAWTSASQTVIEKMTGKDVTYTIDVYIYIDGNNDNVYTNNATNLTGGISFALTASGADRNPQNP